MIALVRHSMRALMPASGDLPGVEDTDLDGFLRTIRREADWLFWLGVELGALVFVLTPLLTLGLPLPSFLLSRRRLDLHAQRIVAHRVYLLRQAVFLVRLTAGLCWGRDPRVRARFALSPYAPDSGGFRTS
jgi:hypothetical protein